MTAYVVGFVTTLFFRVMESVRADLEAQSAAPSGGPIAPDAALDVQVTPSDYVGAER